MAVFVSGAESVPIRAEGLPLTTLSYRHDGLLARRLLESKDTVVTALELVLVDWSREMIYLNTTGRVVTLRVGCC